MKKPSTGMFSLPLSHFETSGWRTVTIARGEVICPDGKRYRVNVRLNADPSGNITLIAEDINKPTDRSNTIIKLTRKP